MPNYEADFQFKTTEFGTIDNVPANNPIDAEEVVMEHVRQTYDDATDIEVVEVREMVQ